MNLDIDVCAQMLAPFIGEHPAISGPHETDYGLGFAPTITYWRHRRRVHLYEDSRDIFTAEIADLDTELVQRCHIATVSAMQDLIENFLCDQCALSELPAFDWIRDAADHDKFIPDPPNQHNPGNFTSWVDGHTVAAFPPAKPIKMVPKWWQFWK